MLSRILDVKMLVLLLGLTIVVDGFNTASAAPDEETLTIGSAAPKLDVEHWLSNGNGRFKPVTSFQPGKVYVVEFWATWCGPCVATMPQLNKLQQEYADKGVQVISISDENLDVVESFLERPVPGQDETTFAKLTGVYSLATDPDGSSHDTYLRASGQQGIPAAYIVGKKGHIEWIGHPLEMKKPLDDVINDKWDREAYSKELEEEKKSFEVFQKVLQSVSRKVQEGETEAAIKMLDDAVAEYADSKVAKELQVARLELLLSTGSERAAKALTDFAAENSEPEILAQLAGGIVQMKVSGEEISADVMKAATRIAEEAVKAKPDDSRFLFTLARVLHQNGNLDKAIEMQKKAMDNAGEFKERIAPFLQILMDEKEEQEGN